MNLIRAAIDNAVADAMAEHPKYFTPKGHEHARVVIVRKIMAALRGDTSEKSADHESGAPQNAAPILAEPHSREAIAYLALRKVARAVAPLRVGDGRISIPPEGQGECVLAFADAPARERWLFVTDRQKIGAWSEFFQETLPSVARAPILVNRDGTDGIDVPWPWPPSVTGKVYEPEHAA